MEVEKQKNNGKRSIDFQHHVHLTAQLYMIVMMSTQDYKNMSPKFIYILLVSDESGNLSLKVFLEKECGNIKNPMR